MKKWLPLITAALLLALGCASHSKAPEHNLVILTTADLQSRVVPYEAKIKGKKQEVGGLERVAGLAKQIREQNSAVLFLSSGDDTMGAFYSMFSGQPEYEGMTLAGYDAVAPGNHEFDFGLDTWKKAVQYAGFDLISANLVVDDPQVAARIQPWVIKEAGGMKVGLFGLIHPQLLQMTNPGPGVRSEPDFGAVARKCIAELKAKGCDLIVAVTHIGDSLDVQLARQAPGIDVIIGGHSHDFVHRTENGTIIVEDGVGATHLGVLRLAVDQGKVKSHTWETVLLDEAVPTDTAVAQRMSNYHAQYVKNLQQPIGRSLAELDARKATVRRKESDLGDLIADSWLAWFPDGDAAVVNGGSIRGDILYPAGPLTMKTVMEIQPFQNDIYKVEMTGRQLKQVLEVSASAVEWHKWDEDPHRPKSGGFLQIGGLRVKLDKSGEPFQADYEGKKVKKILHPGNRVKEVQVRSDEKWESLDSARTYTVLANYWTAIGGDGHYIFLEPGVKKTNTTVVTVDALAAFIKKHTPIDPKTDGRMVWQ